MGLLIGTNRAQALKPKEVIPSRESGTYAIKTILGLERESSSYTVKTVLGWCVVRPISCTSKNSDEVSCSRVSVEDAGSKNFGKHQFCIITEVEDTGIKDILNKIYHTDSTESVQPRKFDKMLNLSEKLS